MRFIKCAERLPEATHPPYLVIVRWWANGEHLRVSTLTPNQLADTLKWATLERHEWLDESLPASIEDEAKALYPHMQPSEYLSMDVDNVNRIADYKRSAHISCARMYIDTIDKLTEQNHKLMAENDTTSEVYGETRDLLEACKSANELLEQEIDKLKAENEKMRKALEELRNHPMTAHYVRQRITEALKTT